MWGVSKQMTEGGGIYEKYQNPKSKQENKYHQESSLLRISEAGHLVLHLQWGVGVRDLRRRTVPSLRQAWAT